MRLREGCVWLRTKTASRASAAARLFPSPLASHILYEHRAGELLKAIPRVHNRKHGGNGLIFSRLKKIRISTETYRWQTILATRCHTSKVLRRGQLPSRLRRFE